MTDTNYGTFVPIKNEINYAITFAKPPEWSISFKPNGTIEMSDSLRDQPEEAARKFLEHLQNQFAHMIKAAELDERDRIVNWLLDEKKGNGNWLDGGRYLAECIADGEHHE